MLASSLIAEKEGYEIRRYEPCFLAQTPMVGWSRNSGFRELFQYISGGNIGSAKLAMTSPVLLKDGEGEGAMAFVMPSGMDLEDLPQPASQGVTLLGAPGFHAAVLRFSGRSSVAILQEKARELTAAIERDGIHPVSAPIYALYDPPWTPPLMRRNEVLIEIEWKPKEKSCAR